jgi:protein SDA1
MIASVRKQQIKAEGNDGEARFAAMQLIDDPQGFAEMLFKKLKEGAQAFETKMLLLQVVSRVVGLHQLILLNFYPFLQRYIQPNQRDVSFVSSERHFCRVSARAFALVCCRGE